MQKIAILTDTTSDVDTSIIKEYNIVEVPLQIIYNSEVTYKDKYEKNIDDIIQDINSNTVSSSLPLTSDLIDRIEYIISEGYTHIIATCMSCCISGTHNLFQQVLSTYSDKITYHLIDSKSCSMGMGFLLEKAAKMIDSGKSFEEIVKELEKYKNKEDLFFTVDKLDYLYTSGRINRSSKVVGNLLNIKPIITCKKDSGNLEVISAVRGRKKVNQQILDYIIDFIGDNEIDNIYIMHSNISENADELEKVIKEHYPNVKIYKRPISSLFVVHTGPHIYGAVVTLK
ncbi:MAG: DegV family protein [Finegoldia magna]|uniref:DegV family protein n=1 Tax=Finegoldia magna TaxID=1260 RepID=UPI000B91D116|nr:DegV family protein [Finegoldia magna]OXZ30861.1 6-phosphogluconate dehydratase [Finegoldia magna]